MAGHKSVRRWEGGPKHVCLASWLAGWLLGRQAEWLVFWLFFWRAAWLLDFAGKPVGWQDA
jgi:hypothetical protein